MRNGKILQLIFMFVQKSLPSLLKFIQHEEFRHLDLKELPLVEPNIKILVTEIVSEIDDFPHDLRDDIEFPIRKFLVVSHVRLHFVIGLKRLVILVVVHLGRAIFEPEVEFPGVELTLAQGVD